MRTAGGAAIRKRAPAATHHPYVRSPLTTADSSRTGTHTFSPAAPAARIPRAPRASTSVRRRSAYAASPRATSRATSGSEKSRTTVSWSTWLTQPEVISIRPSCRAIVTGSPVTPAHRRSTPSRFETVRTWAQRASPSALSVGAEGPSSSVR